MGNSRKTTRTPAEIQRDLGHVLRQSNELNRQYEQLSVELAEAELAETTARATANAKAFLAFAEVGGEGKAGVVPAAERAYMPTPLRAYEDWGDDLYNMVCTFSFECPQIELIRDGYGQGDPSVELSVGQEADIEWEKREWWEDRDEAPEDHARRYRVAAFATRAEAEEWVSGLTS